jgi:hypothetical protein
MNKLILLVWVWPAFSLRAATSASSRLAGNFHCHATFSHLSRLIHLPRHYLLSWPAHSFVAPPSVFSAGALICRDAISSIGWHIQLPRCHIFSASAFNCHAALSWLANLLIVV